MFKGKAEWAGKIKKPADVHLICRLEEESQGDTNPLQTVRCRASSIPQVMGLNQYHLSPTLSDVCH